LADKVDLSKVKVVKATNGSSVLVPLDSSAPLVERTWQDQIKDLCRSDLLGNY